MFSYCVVERSNVDSGIRLGDVIERQQAIIASLDMVFVRRGPTRLAYPDFTFSVAVGVQQLCDIRSTQVEDGLDVMLFGEILGHTNPLVRHGICRCRRVDDRAISVDILRLEVLLVRLPDFGVYVDIALAAIHPGIEHRLVTCRRIRLETHPLFEEHLDHVHSERSRQGT